MLIPAWVIAILAWLYAFEYLYRGIVEREKRYAWMGKFVGRVVLAGTYSIFAIAPIDVNARAIWIRLSLVMFLSIEIFFIAQEHVMRAFFRNNA